MQRAKRFSPAAPRTRPTLRSLPPDVRSVMLTFIPFDEFLRFRSVCRDFQKDVLFLTRMSPTLDMMEFCVPANLHTLYFTDKHARDDMEELVGLPLTPQIVNMRGSNVNDDSIMKLASWWNTVTDLDIGECADLTDDALAALAPLKLKRINVSRCPFTATGLALLPNTLENLIMDSSAVTDEIIHSFTNLIAVTLCSCNFLTKRSVVHLATLPLKHLGLNMNAWLTDACLEPFENHPTLVSIDIGVNPLLTAAALDTVLSIPNLTALNLTHCSWVTNSELKRIALTKKRLENLELRYCFYITAEGVAELMRLRRLFILGLAGCVNVRSNVFEYIRCMERLMWLDVSYLKFEHKHCLILGDMRNLQRLTAKNCSQITPVMAGGLFRYIELSC